MNGLDLFSGIGGITKALDGYVRPVAYCENDRYAQAVLLSDMRRGLIPEAAIWDDVRTLRGEALLDQPEIVYGGFPCQDISVAGRGAGLGGKRSGLFSEIVRLVGEIRPAFIFLENVPAIRTRGGDAVVGELASLGYDARWDVLSASDVGANHRRERWWLLAHTERRRRWESSEPSDSERKSFCEAKRKKGALEFGSSGTDVADATSSRCGQGGSDTRGIYARTLAPEQWSGSANDGWWATEPDVGRVAHGIPFRVDRLRGLGNAVVPAQAREAFERLMGLI